MSVKILGLKELRERIKGATNVVTRRRRQEEGRAVRDFAKSISPVKTGDFKKGWRYKTTGRDVVLLVFNDVPYAQWVHPKGDRTRIQARVRAYADERAPQFATDVANIMAAYIAKFRTPAP